MDRVVPSPVATVSTDTPPSHSAPAAPADLGGDPLQHPGGAQRGQRGDRGRGGQLLGDLDQ